MGPHMIVILTAFDLRSSVQQLEGWGARVLSNQPITGVLNSTPFQLFSANTSRKYMVDSGIYGKEFTDILVMGDCAPELINLARSRIRDESNPNHGSYYWPRMFDYKAHNSKNNLLVDYEI